MDGEINKECCYMVIIDAGLFWPYIFLQPWLESVHIAGVVKNEVYIIAGKHIKPTLTAIIPWNHEFVSNLGMA